MEEDRIALEQYENPILNLIARWNYYRHAEHPVDFLREAMHTVSPKEDDVILDVGCSYGQDLLTIRSEYEFRGKLIGLEKAQDAFSFRGRYVPPPNQRFITEGVDTVNWLVGDAEQIPLNDDSVDVLFASRMLYHVPDHRKALDEFKRVVKPNGYILVTTTGLHNKLRHRKFEEGIGLHLNAQPPTRFANRFPAELANQVLAELFTIEKVKLQYSRALFDSEGIDDFLLSLQTMKPSFHPMPNSESWNDAVAKIVLPYTTYEIQHRGFFTDIINQQQFICRNTK